MLGLLVSFDFSFMPTILLFFFVLIGITGLVLGGRWLTDGAIGISSFFNISPLIVGLTVVSIATSMPEMFTCLTAIQESADLALGSIIGSNIANIGLILGISALIAPLASDIRLIRKELPFLIFLTFLFVLFALGGFGRIEGIILVSIAFAYVVWVVRNSLKESSNNYLDEDLSFKSASRSNLMFALIWIILGTIFLSLGAQCLVSSAQQLALRIGVSEVFVGFSVVALGTSLPELAASVSASFAKKNSLCIGNVIGSNLFNLALIGGTSACFYPFPVSSSFFWVEFPLLIFSTILLFFFLRKTDSLIGMKRGVVLITLYLFVIVLIGLK
ncbi:MAG: Inner membrane protein YrbG [Puniceicoccaceae bacterium MED-G32]|nr:MAG: Inner membrane protein YrbG [Puniceicoccaceae bacterium MED-G32]